MKIGMQVSYAGGFKESAAMVRQYEQIGLDVAWVAEAYGLDAVSYMGYLAATTERVEIASGILPIFTRTPTLIAQTAAGIDAMSDGRCVLGLGASGPQVIEGWHGVPYDAPIGRTREIIEICRAVWKREGPLEHDGRYYQLPLPEEKGTGLGKALKIIGRPVRSAIPIYVASLGAKNVQMTAEIADGWLPIFYLPERAEMVWGADLATGKAKRSPDLGPLEIAAGGFVAITDEPEKVLDFGRSVAALYIGGMGAKGKNFYNELACRYGYEKEAEEIQDLYLAGKKDEAAAKVPMEFLQLTNLVGSEGWIKDRVQAFKDSGVTTLNVNVFSDDPASVLEKLKAWAD